MPARHLRIAAGAGLARLLPRRATPPRPAAREPVRAVVLEDFLFRPEEEERHLEVGFERFMRASRCPKLASTAFPTRATVPDTFGAVYFMIAKTATRPAQQSTCTIKCTPKKTCFNPSESTWRPISGVRNPGSWRFRPNALLFSCSPAI